jgi:hypothetical protein
MFALPSRTTSMANVSRLQTESDCILCVGLLSWLRVEDWFLAYPDCMTRPNFSLAATGAVLLVFNVHGRFAARGLRAGPVSSGRASVPR